MIVFDCEIIKAIPQKGKPNLPGIEYCAGWHDISNMGISVIGAYDFRHNEYHIYLEDNFHKFQELVDERGLIIGFNSWAFDNELCYANGLVIPFEKSWDLLVEIWKGCGLRPKFSYPTHIGYGLDAMARTNLKLGKSGDGALAPVDWQQGRRGAVMDYCLHDVYVTAALLQLAQRQKGLVSPKNNKWIEIDTTKLEEHYA